MAARKPSQTKRKKYRQQTKAARKELSQGARLLLAGLFLIAFVAISLFALTLMRQKLLPVEQPLVYEEPHGQVIETDRTFDNVLRLVENQLINGPQTRGRQVLSASGQVSVIKVCGAFPGDLYLAELKDHLEGNGSAARLNADRDQGTITLLWQNEVRLRLLYQQSDKSVSAHKRVAIIMDDLGDSLSTIESLLDLDLPVTPAILPWTEKTIAVTSLLHAAQREYMIHIPMQPRSYPRISPGPNALLLGQTETEIRHLLRSYMERVPGAVGGNNHMGSSFTEDSELMRVVLDELKQHDFFFIDSRTISSSVAFSEARKMGVRTASRQIFLDNQEDVNYIRQQLRKMVGLTAENQDVVAICHPYPETLAALREDLDWLKNQPIEFVPASRIVRRY